ncbi:MAG TPA: hypothetical protein VNY27_10975 [Solirubrobacteraceae bacterium]|jgi:hypothetical protein|nr:hypothetical protein [Solirubrobacteraceae bacterium]
MSAWLIVPAGMVGLLREGLHSEIEAAVQLIAPVVEAPDRDEHPERYRVPLARLDAARALLDLVGWSSAGPPVDVRVDLREHHRVLLRALRSELLIEEEALGSIQEGNLRDAAKRRGIVERAEALRELISTIEARIGALGGDVGGEDDEGRSQNERRHPQRPRRSGPFA